MPYSLLGLVGRDMRVANDNLPGSELISLAQEFEIVPLTVHLLRNLTGDLGVSPIYLDDGHSGFLTRIISGSLGRLQSLPFVFLEIDCEGGRCFRAAALFSDFHMIWMASHHDLGLELMAMRLIEVPDMIRATNQALRLIGVNRLADEDELSALGLTRPPFRTAWNNFYKFSMESPGS